MENIDSADVMDPTELQRIREQADWQALFLGLGLVKDDSRSTDTDWWAISPFEAKARPSFHLNDQGLWYDFGLKKGGGFSSYKALTVMKRVASFWIMTG